MVIAHDVTCDLDEDCQCPAGLLEELRGGNDPAMETTLAEDLFEDQLDRAADEAIRTFGVEHQLGIAQEECSELVVAISHLRRKRSGYEKVAEEMADVEMLLRQLRKVIEARLPADTMRKARATALARLQTALYDERVRRLEIPPGATLQSWDGTDDF